MNRKELTAAVAQKTGLYQKEVDQVVGTLIEEIQAQLAKGTTVKIQGLGTFEVVARAPRTGRDLINGGTVQVPGRLVPGFKASRLLKELIERP